MILESAARVLRCFGPDCTSLTVSGLVERLGMPKSNASRLLRAMRDAGLLENVGETRRFRPGLLLLEAARVYPRSSSLIERAARVVAEVSASCGHTGYVSVRDDAVVTAVTDHPGTNALRVASNIGRRLPASASATGRSLLARLPDEAVRALLQEPLDMPTANAPRTLAELMDLLHQVRRDGYALSREETTRGVDAIAVAVSDPLTGEEASLCIVFPGATTGPGERQAIRDALLAGARAIEPMSGPALRAA